MSSHLLIILLESKVVLCVNDEDKDLGGVLTFCSCVSDSTFSIDKHLLIPLVDPGEKCAGGRSTSLILVVGPLYLLVLIGELSRKTDSSCATVGLDVRDVERQIIPSAAAANNGPTPSLSCFEFC